MNNDLSTLAGEVISADSSFRAAHQDFKDAEQTFTIASTARTDMKKIRKAAISALESLLKKLKSEA